MSNVDMRTSPATPSGTFGTILRCVEVPGIRAAEAVYPKVRSLPLHEHEHPFVTYVLSGEYAEMAGS